MLHTPTILQLMDSLAKEGHNPKYTAFFAWLVDAVGNDDRRNKRVEALATYKQGNLDDILLTTPFDIPANLQTFFAIMYDVDRQRAENEYKEKNE